MKRFAAFIFGVTIGGILGSFFERFLFENAIRKYENRLYKDHVNNIDGKYRTKYSTYAYDPHYSSKGGEF